MSLYTSEFGDLTVFNSSGFSIESEGCGDGFDGLNCTYVVERGEYYYIRVRGTEQFKLKTKIWLPIWNKDGSNDESVGYLDLIGTRNEKVFENENNTLWNTYYLTGKIDVNFGVEETVDFYGTMVRLASPVNIYTTTSFTSNKEVLHSQSYKYDPNDPDECYRLDIDTDQDTMVDELLLGEKEYRMDTVYYLMPATGQFILEESRYIYIPVGYVINAETDHVVKCEDHITNVSVKENIKEATCTEQGSYDLVLYCEACGLEVNREKVIVPAVEHSFDNNLCTNCKVEYCTSYGHKDFDNDEMCDNCNALLGVTNPPVIAPNCDCNCHSENIIQKIVYKIVLVFWKLLRLNSECDCGATHY